MTAAKITAVIGVLIFVLSASLPGDSIFLKDGRVITGTVVQQDDAKVVVEVEAGQGGLKVRLTLRRDDIQKIVKQALPRKSKTHEPQKEPKAVGRPKQPKPKYYVVRLHGEVGRYITASIIGKILVDAAKRKPDIVVLEIDSPGGHIQEAKGIIKLLADSQHLHIVAYVKDAISAATPIALACKEIYVAPSAKIGGALSFRIGPSGTPTVIEAKYQSIWRAS